MPHSNMKDYTYLNYLLRDRYIAYIKDSLLNHYCLFIFLISFSLHTYAQPKIKEAQFIDRTVDQPDFESKEELINSLINSYPLENDIKLKLSAYAELKGRYSDSTKTLSMDFGNLGTLYFFHDNCLLKNKKNEVYYIDRKNPHLAQVEAFNEGVQQLFEHINLTGNYHASTSHVDLVATHLAKKNIEPFYKLFVRHLLISYGEYDPIKKRVEFHSDRLPRGSQEDLQDESLVGGHFSPLKIVLEGKQIRGYYLDVGGEVYIEDEKTQDFYVSGEDYKYNNVTAFKLFISKLFSQSIQYIAPKESKRIAQLNKHKYRQEKVSEKPTASAVKKARVLKVGSQIHERTIYTPYSWIGMMLSMLRVNKVNIGDPDIIKYFVDRPYFSNIYGELLPNERQAVDRYLTKNNKHGYSRGPSNLDDNWTPTIILDHELEAKGPLKNTEWFINTFHVQP